MSASQKRHTGLLVIALCVAMLMGGTMMQAQQTMTATQTAQAIDPFAQTATQVVREATWTAAVSTPTPRIVRTATPFAIETTVPTVIAEVTVIAQTAPSMSPATDDDPLLVTLMIFVGLSVILVIAAGAAILVDGNRAGGKRP